MLMYNTLLINLIFKCYLSIPKTYTLNEIHYNTLYDRMHQETLKFGRIIEYLKKCLTNYYRS